MGHGQAFEPLPRLLFIEGSNPSFSVLSTNSSMNQITNISIVTPLSSTYLMRFFIKQSNVSGKNLIEDN